MKRFVLTAAFVQLIAAQTAPPGPVRSDPVVAVVDGKEVTAEDFRRMAETSPPSFAQSFQKDPSSLRSPRSRQLAALLRGDDDHAVYGTGAGEGVCVCW